MLPALGFVFRIEAEVNQRIVAFTGFHHNIATITTVAARGTSTRFIGFAPESDTAVSAISGLDSNCCFINKHRKSQSNKKPQPEGEASGRF
jgi:hypothetical protein